MTKFLLAILSCLTLNYCGTKTPKNKMNIIYYGTSDFDVFENKASIKKEQAWNILNEFIETKKLNTLFLF